MRSLIRTHANKRHMRFTPKDTFRALINTLIGLYSCNVNHIIKYLLNFLAKIKTFG